MKKRLSYLLLTVTTVIWGIAFVMQGVATAIPPFAVGALRSLLAALMLFSAIPLMDRITKNGRRLFVKKRIFDFNRYELIGGTILGVIITVATGLQQYGLAEGTDEGKAAFITALYVVFVPVISTLLGKKPSLFAIVSIPIAIVGSFLLCIDLSKGFSVQLSDLLILACALIFACHIIVVDRFSPKCDGIRMSFIQFTVSSVLNLVLALMFEKLPQPEAVLSVLPALIYLGVLSSGVGYTLQIIGQKGTDPTISSMIMSLESVFGVLSTALFMHKFMELREYIGCAVMLLAILLAQLDAETVKKLFKKKGA